MSRASPKWSLVLNNTFTSVLYAASGIVIGLHVGISERAELLAVTALIPLLWRLAKTRLNAFLLVLAYYLTAARGVPAGAATFFGDNGHTSFMFGIFLWLASSISLTLPWTLLWREYSALPEQILRQFLVFWLITIPPIGLFGWASPLLSGGILFPGSGWLGIAASVAISPLIFTPLSQKEGCVSHGSMRFYDLYSCTCIYNSPRYTNAGMIYSY